MKHSKTSVLIAGILSVLVFSARPGFAQGGFTSTVQQFRGSGGTALTEQALGQDFWFAPIESYGNDTTSGSYYLLYVTSPDTGFVNVQLGSSGASYGFRVLPLRDTTVLIPLSWIVRSSGKVENKGIHVWSNVPLTCHVMSHNPYTSDGTYIIPTMSWGTEYVVAGYSALFESSGSYVYDIPSEFSIVASHDNTYVTITPSTDFRVESTNSACCSCLFASIGIPFTIILNRGDAVQFKTTCTQDCDNTDVTGTVITSNYSVGVIGGSQCPNIPCDFPYCDHVCHMLPPISSWGKTYYSVPFYQPVGMPQSHNASTFLVIATKPGQIIRRYDSDRQQDEVHFLASGKYDYYWRNDINQASRWTSDTAFLLVQYMNSSTYPDNAPGSGDPSEVVLPPIEQFTKSVLFQSATVTGNQTPFANYVNIVAKVGDKNVMLDGAHLTAQSIVMDGNYVGYRAAKVVAGAHTVTSDWGVGVYCYGYGYDESYSWAGSIGNASKLSAIQDSIPPIATVGASACQSIHVTVSDTGKIASKLTRPTVDTALNITCTIDPLWVAGDSVLYYDAIVIDPSKSALLRISVYDLAGNWTTIRTTYTPTSAGRIGPFRQSFRSGDTSTCTYSYDTILNTGVGSFSFTGLKLARGNQGFSIDSAVTDPLAQGESRLIKLCYRPFTSQQMTDTLEFTSACGRMFSILYGSIIIGGGGGGLMDFVLTDHDFGSTVLGETLVGSAFIINRSTFDPIQIDSVWLDNPWNFQIQPNQTGHVAPPKFSIALNGADTVQFQFATQLLSGIGPYEVKWHALSRGIIGLGETGIRTGTLTAYVNPSPAGVAQPTFIPMSISVTPNPAQDEIELLISGAIDPALQVVLLDVLGRTVPLPPAPLAAGGGVRLDVSGVNDGVYYLRVATNGTHAMRRVVIQR